MTRHTLSNINNIDNICIVYILPLSSLFYIYLSCLLLRCSLMTTKPYPAYYMHSTTTKCHCQYAFASLPILYNSLTTSDPRKSETGLYHYRNRTSRTWLCMNAQGGRGTKGRGRLLSQEWFVVPRRQPFTTASKLIDMIPMISDATYTKDVTVQPGPTATATRKHTMIIQERCRAPRSTAETKR
jgi:hypothetical protein